MSTTTKAERLEVRLSETAKALITQAAQLRHTSVSEFMLSSAVAAAEDVLAMPKVFYADEAGWKQVMDRLNAGPEDLPDVTLERWRQAKARR